MLKMDSAFAVGETDGGPSRNHLSGSFADNKDIPIHRWFKYSAGFSGRWVEAVLEHEKPKAVLDPFAGCGTTLISAEQCGVSAWGIEPHPFVARVVKAKLTYRSDPTEFYHVSQEVLTQAQNMTSHDLSDYAPLIRNCYSDNALQELDCLKQAVLENQNSACSELLWLALVAILRPASHAGTANCQYILPRHRKSVTRNPFALFDDMVDKFRQDMIVAHVDGPSATFHLDDARHCHTLPTNHFDLVITSPPYPNNYDYADATRLEMTFLGEVDCWGDLHDSVRSYLLTSCTQQAPDRLVDLEHVLSQPELAPIREEISTVCHELGKVRLNKGGKKTYHNMVACYFLDLAKVWLALRRVCKSPSKACFVIGDSAPYGVYVPVAEWLAALATAAGFSSAGFEKIRDRNIKWKNRKHRVPLCEGRLWVRG
jgi:hypothetical protein